MFITKNQALAIASMAELVSKDTPLFKLVKVSVVDGVVEVMATDKYLAGLMTFPAVEGWVNSTFMFSPEVIKFIKDNAKTTSTFVIENNTITAGESSIGLGDSNNLQWPDIKSIFTNQAERVPSDATALVDLSATAKIAKIFNPEQAGLTSARRSAVWRMSFGGATTGYNGNTKPLPIIYETEGIKVLQQPRMER